MSKVLVAYFSASGATKKVAEKLKEAVGADIFEIKAKVPYTDKDLDWEDNKSRSSVEMNDTSSRPEIASNKRRNSMKKIYIFLTVFLISIITSITAFGAEKEILIAYFSRAGENYNVGNVSRGSTEIIAEMIAKETGGNLFKIDPVTPYPTNYNETVRIARDEKRNSTRPKIKNKVNNLQNYDVIFLGYPIWHGDLPMVFYTFFDENNLSGKTIILFSTHEGSGLADTVNSIEKYTKGNVVRAVLSVRGKKVQDYNGEVEIEVKEWIKHLKSRDDTGNFKE